MNEEPERSDGPPNVRFNRERWVEEVLAGRKLLVLDLNYWIRMATDAAGPYADLLGALRRKVADGKLLCPVPQSVLNESFKCPDRDVRQVRFAMMDALSWKAILLPAYEIYRCEYRAYRRSEPIRRTDPVTHLLDKLLLRIPQPADLWKRIDGTALEYLEGQGISEFMGILPESETSELLDVDKHAYLEVASLLNELHVNTDHPAAALDRVVEVMVVKGFLGEETDDADEEECQRILRSCPALACLARLYVVLRRHGQVNPNDAWDADHVAPAVPYVDAVAPDNRTWHLTANECHMERDYPGVLVKGVKGVTDWVLSL
jgi:hypothetical protein